MGAALRPNPPSLRVSIGGGRSCICASAITNTATPNISQRTAAGFLCLLACTPRPELVEVVHEHHGRRAAVRALERQLAARKIGEQGDTLLVAECIAKHDGASAGLAVENVLNHRWLHVDARS